MASRVVALVVVSCLFWSVLRVEGQTPTTADRLRQVTYPVADLVVPIGGIDHPHGTRDAEKQTKEGRLIQLLERTVAPGTWSATGGRGTLQYFPQGMTLVVCQTAAVQTQVADLLETLRRAQNVQIAFEVRVVEMPARVVRAATLDEPRLQEMLRGLQGSRDANVVIAPKLTTFNGQRASIQVDGFRCAVQGFLGADLHQIQVNFQARFGGVEFAKTTTVPEGTTLVLAERKDDKTNLVFLVTPRLLINLEEPQASAKRHDPLLRASAVEVKPAPLPPAIRQVEHATKPAPPALNEKLARILERYGQACASGDNAKARRLAQRALEIDPACFQRSFSTPPASFGR